MTNMRTSMERVFRKTPDGLFREVILHYLHFIDSEGNTLRSKLDKSIPGKLYKIAGEGERSQYGEVEYTFPGTEEPVRLVALALDRRDTDYGI